MAIVTGKLLPFRGRVGQKQTTDLDLLWYAATGDSAALRDLFYRHGDLVFRVLRIDCGLDQRLAGRLLRDTFLEVWRSARAFKARQSVVGQIVRIAMRVGVRKSSHRETSSAGTSDLSRLIREVDATGLSREAIALEERVAELPWGMRMATVLIERERLEEEAAAEALGVKPRVIWRWVAKARWQTRPARVEGGSTRRVGRIRLALATGRICPPEWVLNRAASSEIVPRIGWHTSVCLDCRRELAELMRISERLAALPRPEMSAALKNEIANSLLTAPIG